MYPLSIANISRLYVLLILFTCSIVVISDYHLRLKAEEDYKHWLQFHYDLSHRLEIYDKLAPELGYGGVIHLFKNYLLRGEDHYHNGALTRLAASKKLLIQYRQLNPSEQEIASIDKILQTLLHYQQQLEKIRELIAINISPKIIDQRVKIDDNSALKSLQSIRSILDQQQKTSLQNIQLASQLSRKLRTIYTWSAVSAVILIVIFPFWLMRNWILTPLTMIGYYLKKMAQGDNILPIPKTKQCLEIDQISSAINDLQLSQHELQETQQKLHQQYRLRYSDIFDNIKDGMLIIDTKTLKIAEVNSSLCKMLNMSALEIKSKSLQQLLNTYPDKKTVNIQEWLRSPLSYEWEFDFIPKQGEMISLQLSPFKLAENIAILFHNITEQKMHGKKLKQLLEDNRALTTNSLAILETERSHLSRELHDEMGQLITAIKFDASYLANELKEKEQIKAIKDIMELCNSLLNTVQSITQRLRPSTLDQLGLAESLQELTADWQQRIKKCNYKLYIKSDINDLDETTNIAIYRLLQEALNNIAKHSSASKVTINLQKDNYTENLQISIQDNGNGINNTKNNTGLGLLGMRERSKALGGSFTVNSKIGHGTHILINLPMSEKMRR